MLKYTLVFLFIWVCSSFQTSVYSQNLSIEIYNKTGITLDSVQLDTLYIGTLMNDSSAILMSLKELKHSGPWPLISIKAVDTSGGVLKNRAHCSTKAISAKDGYYAFDIILNNRIEHPFLELIAHK